MPFEIAQCNKELTFKRRRIFSLEWSQSILSIHSSHKEFRCEACHSALAWQMYGFQQGLPIKSYATSILPLLGESPLKKNPMGMHKSQESFCFSFLGEVCSAVKDSFQMEFLAFILFSKCGWPWSWNYFFTKRSTTAGTKLLIWGFPTLTNIHVTFGCEDQTDFQYRWVPLYSNALHPNSRLIRSP